ncbi:hypothetical protein EU508_03130 [Pseudoalteromonas fuliginea]|uniref:DUF916 domain-containing protein n=1 Tax=Pseudoalteromonas fuliginea TaxID=1872678 RepID=A0AB73BL33_9GAMM|nr:hypothetical protein [Pseudoalteromonas fuliginea]KAA1163857.1 hypothetical protein EU508_03130 [Pseudoalteromonas fuliginea]
MNWRSILATALITGIVTVSTGMLLFWWQTDKSELSYNSIKSIPFDDANNKFYIQQVEIKNSGDKPIEDVVLLLSFSDGLIEKSKISIDQAIAYSNEVKSKSIRLLVDNLNPGEGANISVIYQSKSDLSTGAKISLRGKGIKGKLNGSVKNQGEESLIISLLAAYAGIFAFIISRKRGRQILVKIIRRRIFGDKLSSGSQKNTIASLLSIYGYPEKAKEYLNAGLSRQYWIEADLLASEAILGNIRLKNDMIKILSRVSMLPNINKTSKSVVIYNIARINKSLGNDIESDTNLEIAKDLDRLEIESRIEFDPLFSS